MLDISLICAVNLCVIHKSRLRKTAACDGQKIKDKICNLFLLFSVCSLLHFTHTDKHTSFKIETPQSITQLYLHEGKF